MGSKNRLAARIKAWQEEKPRTDVDAKNAILAPMQTYFRKPGSQNKNK